jgi:AbiU2
MLALIEVLETGNEHAVVKAINAAEAVRAAQLVRHALFAHLHILVSRAYSRARDRDLHAQRAFDLLTEPAVRAKVAERGIEDDLAEAERLWRSCRGDHRLKAFLHYRDKYLAHRSEPTPGIPRPLVMEAFEIANATVNAIERLAHGTGVVGLSLASQLPAYSESAQRFWAPWAR